ncbi:MAG: hypothetical protein KJ950_14925 [Proteobacteria bacterium]|nr:hypothetical protein [Pseudomonadota bacterium]MBU1688628.1 hypothetical protein [Pseudomonadota bacterium]
MRRIILLITVLLAWSGFVTGAELKVMVPIDDFKQMKSRLDSLESENVQLKQEVRTLNRQGDGTQVESMKGRLESLEQENNQLRQQASAVESKAVAPVTDSEMGVKISSLEQENYNLRRRVLVLKDEGLAASYSEDRRSAKHVYSSSRGHDYTKNVFKF